MTSVPDMASNSRSQRSDPPLFESDEKLFNLEVSGKRLLIYLFIYFLTAIIFEPSGLNEAPPSSLKLIESGRGIRFMTDKLSAESKVNYTER